LQKIDKIKIIHLLKDFEQMCEERGIKFSRFTEEELMEILMLYKAYRSSGDPPF